MSDIEAIAETMISEFSTAVKATTKARTAAVDAIQSARDDAGQARSEGLARVRKLREDAARMIGDSIREEERVEAAYRHAQGEVDAMLAELRGPARLATRPPLTAIPGGHAA